MTGPTAATAVHVARALIDADRDRGRAQFDVDHLDQAGVTDIGSIIEIASDV